MPVRKTCIVSGDAVRSLDDVYDQLSKGLSLPDYFGRNLDALRDVLSADVEGPFEIVWKHAGASRKALGKDFERVTGLLRRLERERDDFSLRVED